MSWRDKKQRHGSLVPITIVSAILFPVVLSVILVASAASAPLLPLFTLPLFIVGFPRSIRTWPSAVGSSANVCDDTVYYKHMAPQLAKALSKAFANGSLGI